MKLVNQALPPERSLSYLCPPPISRSGAYRRLGRRYPPSILISSAFEFSVEVVPNSSYFGPRAEELEMFCSPGGASFTCIRSMSNQTKSSALPLEAVFVPSSWRPHGGPSPELGVW